MRFKLNALISDGSGGTALTIVRSLGRRDLKITVGARRNYIPSFFSKYCKERFIHTSPKKNETKYLKEMLQKVKETNYDVLFPLGTPEMQVISKHRDKFKPYVKIPLVDYDTLERANDKAETIKIAMENDIPCPKTYFIEDFSELREIKNTLEYPVVIKPRKSTGSKGLCYVGSKDEFLSCYERVARNYRNPLIQEYIPQGGDTYGLEALFNKNFEPRALFVHKRLREYPVTGGPSTLRESVDNPEIKKLGVKLLKAFNWYGLAMVEFKMDPRDNKPKLMEINPRFWGSLPLAIASGVDFPFLLYKMAMNGDIRPVLDYKVGMKCRWLLFGDIKYFIKVMAGTSNSFGFKNPSRYETLLNFLRFYEKDLVYDYLSMDDPMPALVKCLSPILGLIN